MSSSEDSETAEWEREQMMRGTQSRGRHQKQQQHTSTSYHQASSANSQASEEQNSDVIDASRAKHHVKCDIDKVEEDMRTIKRNIGGTQIEIAKSNKKILAMKKQIEQLEQAEPFFEQLAKLKEFEEVIKHLDSHRSLIARLPHDQKEMIDLLEGNMRGAHQSTMEVDI